MMNNLKLGLNILGKYVVCIVMCFFITFSFIAIFSMMSLEMVGYEAAVFENEKAEEPIEQYTHYYSDGDDAKKADYEAKKYIVVTREFAGEFSGSPYITCHIVAQAISLVLFVVIVPHTLYKQGRLDANAVSCGRMEEDKLRGLKASLIPSAVSLASWVCLILAKLQVFKAGLQIYSFANYHLYGFQKLIFGNVDSAAQISWSSMALALIPVLLTVAACAVTYILGYKDINLYEKTVYENV
jgi:hypothetical protein